MSICCTQSACVLVLVHSVNKTGWQWEEQGQQMMLINSISRSYHLIMRAAESWVQGANFPLQVFYYWTVPRIHSWSLTSGSLLFRETSPWTQDQRTKRDRQTLSPFASPSKENSGSRTLWLCSIALFFPSHCVFESVTSGHHSHSRSSLLFAPF